MFSCILLSAGASSRFGSPKALARHKGETVVGSMQKMLLNTQIGEIIVVLGAQADQIQPHVLKHTKIKFVYNKDHNFGQTSSFKAGLRVTSRDSEAFLLLPIDYPFISGKTIDQEIAFYRKNAPLIIIPAWEGRKGHPPLFAGSLREDILALKDQYGLNSVAHAHPAETEILPVTDPGVIQTFNTPEEFKMLKQSDA